jgi:cytochrome c5
MNTKSYIRILIAFMFVASGVLLSRCYYDSEEYLFPETGNNCDTANASYSLSVFPILDNKCLTCHSNASAAALGGNVKLENYADVKARADDGKLIGTITHASGFVPMPMGGSKLDDCSISVIQKWIDNGSLND